MSGEKPYVIPISSFSLSLSSSLPLSLMAKPQASPRRGHGFLSQESAQVRSWSMVGDNLEPPREAPSPMSDSTTSNQVLMMCLGMMRKGSIFSKGRWICLGMMRKGSICSKGSWICLGMMRKGSIYSKESWICLGMMSKGSICSKESWIMPRNARRKP